MKSRAIDTPFLLVLCALVVFGLLIFTSAALSLLAVDGATFTSVAVSQLFLGFVCGGIALVVLSRIDYRSYKKYTPHFFALAMLLTILTFVPHVGVDLKGASRWLALGPVSFQPVEVLKLAVVALLAAVYASHFKDIRTMRYGIVPLILIAGSATILVILQPDTASAMMIAAAGAMMLFAAGGRMIHLVLLAIIGVGLVAGAAIAYPHVRERLETYFNQTSDPEGTGYQINQSLIAVGSGGITGQGFGQGVEKFSYLPEPIGDSVFAVEAEEFGFIGSIILVALYVALGLLGLRIAARAPDPFGGLLIIGIIVLIVGQSFFNIASAIALVPLVGVPLIFVSHGGTALAIALAEIGIILSVSRRMKSSG